MVLACINGYPPPRVSEDQGCGSVTQASTIIAAIRSRSEVENASKICANEDTRAEARNVALPKVGSKDSAMNTPIWLRGTLQRVFTGLWERL